MQVNANVAIHLLAEAMEFCALLELEPFPLIVMVGPPLVLPSVVML